MLGGVEVGSRRWNAAVFSKTKSLTQATDHLLAALSRQPRIRSARHMHHRRYERWLGRRLGRWWGRKVIERLRPELVIINQQDILPEWLPLLRNQGAVIAYVQHAYRDPVPANRLEIARQSDLVYLANERQIEQFLAAGAPRVRYLFRGCSRDDHHPVAPDSIEPRWRADVAFIGQPRRDPNKFRNRLIRAVAERFAIKLYGGAWERIGLPCEQRRVRAAEYRKICSGSKIVLGISDASADTLEQIMTWRKYTSNREHLTLGCGGFLLTNYVEGLEEVFEPGVHLDTYRSIEECLDKIAFYLERPALRRRIAQAGCRLVHERYTFDHFVGEIVRDAEAVRAGRAT